MNYFYSSINSKNASIGAIPDPVAIMIIFIFILYDFNENSTDWWNLY